ncbi:MAG TPA: NADH-quinone oxidoreductase subunit L [Burkholderiales bacterium]|nr:NADH-quinone oxidoreductase subunit L [Burkholderiales bacterium]
MTRMELLYLLVPLAPLAGAIVAGLFGRVVGRAGAHWVTIVGVGISFVASCAVFVDVLNGNTYNGTVYTWLTSGGTRFEIGFLIDRLTTLMMVVVTFVSWMVHVYTIGYMADDPGYQRFFAYISLFTFAMLMLVMANNFLQLFFGWEAVGVVSYLLIGFWYTRPTAVYANLKAFIVNRIGDFGFLLGIALILAHTGTLDYAEVFAQAPKLAADALEIIPGTPWLAISVICICLFIGAMGKSAQFPLHVWLPDSMEGPTPISALIHAATMVTAGIFMVARMSPLFEFSDAARSVVIVIGGITAFFMALIAIVNYDIKRVVAYSTLSHLGYMTVALGASAYPVAMFHLYTHAFFKAALFLAAGSVIIALHHEQDMRRMGGLRKYMPITYLTVLVGGLANAAVPPFAGFFSKDAIIEATRLAAVPGAGFAYLCVLATAFVTAFYTFRLIFLVFHGKERFDRHGHGHDEHGQGGPPHESPPVVTVPLILLAVPSICAGWLIGWIAYGDYFAGSIYVSPEHGGLAELAREFHGVMGMVTHAFFTVPFWLVVAGIALAYYLYIVRPDLPGVIREKAGILTRILENKYGFDDFNQRVLADGTVKIGSGLWKAGDVTLIDGLMVNGSARLVGLVARIVRLAQTGFIYTYAFVMIFGVFVLLSLWLYRIWFPS